MHHLRKIFYLFSKQMSSESGAILVMFALMLPLLLLFYSMAFDSAKVQRESARLADGMNQAALAVALADNRNETPVDRRANNELLQNYLEYYLPGADISADKLNVTARINYHDKEKLRPKSVDYGVSGVAVMHPVFTNKTSQPDGIGYSKDISMGIGSGAGSGSGVVRKTLAKFSSSTDYAFVVDFSGSMRDLSSDPRLTRMEMLHKVMDSFGQQVLEDNPYTAISIVPFSVGVAVKSQRYNNDMPGEFELECSWVGELRSDYKADPSSPVYDLKRINFDFWYNKNAAASDKELTQRYNYDKSLYDYYRLIIGPAMGITGKNDAEKMNPLVDRGWCKNNIKESTKDGYALYSCDADSRSNIFNNFQEFSETYQAARALVAHANSTSGYSITTINTLDFDAMFADAGYLFRDSSIKTLPLFYAKRSSRPFEYMCGAAFGPKTVDDDAQVKKSIQNGKTTGAYLIELTSDVNILNEFSEMNVVSNAAKAYTLTDSSSGLLRALPVIVKGVNPRKVIVIISDGLDTGTDTRGPRALSNKLHKEYKICDRIRYGLKKYSVAETTSVDLYYISLTRDASRVKFWADNCVGPNNAFTATNYEQLIDTLTGITQKESFHFVNDRD